MTRPTYAYTADLVVIAEGHVLLVKRGKEPFGLALPGGHVDPDERARGAAVREAQEETGLAIRAADLTLVPGEWDDPDRDPRRRTITAAFTLRLDQRPATRPGDDAAATLWVPLSELRSVKWAFSDHAQIITAALADLPS